MGSKSTKKAKDKKILDQQKSDKSIDKLKKKKKTVAEEKISAEKKLKKLKERKGKKGKLKKLKELLTKLLKKEKKVASKLKESKKNKADKDKKDGEKTRLPDKKIKGKRASKTIVDIHPDDVEQDAKHAASDKQSMEEIPDQPLNHSSVDHLAKEAIALVRKLNSVQDIDLFVLGDKRSTVLKAAHSRKNSLARK
jgi:hypothetical protein